MTSNGALFHPITKLEEAQVMRTIRNECREYMTKDTSLITEERQEEWFNGLDKDRIKMFLMYKCHNSTLIDTIGFGYCCYTGDEVYVTGGLTKDYRDKGYGKTLFTHLVETAKSFNTRITLEVLNTNTRAKRLYENIGFHSIEADDRITKMEYIDD